MADATTHPEVARVGRVIQDHLSDILPLFAPGTMLTFVARQPSHPDGSRDMVVTMEDALADVIRALEVRSHAV